jgi:putative AlgH/UPF0301 family transcriptional regulator
VPPGRGEHRELGAGLCLSLAGAPSAAPDGAPAAKRTVVLAGYAGWGPGQLDQGSNRSSWLIMPVESSI